MRRIVRAALPAILLLLSAAQAVPLVWYETASDRQSCEAPSPPTGPESGILNHTQRHTGQWPQTGFTYSASSVVDSISVPETEPMLDTTALGRRIRSSIVNRAPFGGVTHFFGIPQRTVSERRRL
jgi:hypothetical protein